jgi:hypothetical protein
LETVQIAKMAIVAVKMIRAEERGDTGAACTVTVLWPPHSPAERVARQLSDRERDPLYRTSMSVAQVMARSLLE